MTQKDHFEETFRAFVTGDLNRLSVMLRTGAIAGAAAAATVAGLAGVGAAFAQDATPDDPAGIMMSSTLPIGMQVHPGTNPLGRRTVAALSTLWA